MKKELTHAEKLALFEEAFKLLDRAGELLLQARARHEIAMAERDHDILSQHPKL